MKKTYKSVLIRISDTNQIDYFHQCFQFVIFQCRRSWYGFHRHERVQRFDSSFGGVQPLERVCRDITSVPKVREGISHSFLRLHL